MNVCVFQGNVSREPELRFSASGAAFCKFGLAVNYGWGDKKTVSFLNMTAFAKTAEAIGNYINKGSKVTVRCHVQTGSYEKDDGTKVYTTDFIVDEIDFPSKKESQGQPQEDVFEPTDDNPFEPTEEDIPF